MDSRVTLAGNENFVELLTSCAVAGEKVSLLYDDGGLTRAEGFVSTLSLDATPAFLQLQNGQTILLETVVAVNGIFLSSYSEC